MTPTLEKLLVQAEQQRVAINELKRLQDMFETRLDKAKAQLGELRHLAQQVVDDTSIHTGVCGCHPTPPHCVLCALEHYLRGVTK